MENSKPKKDEWVKVQSKSRPGRCYLFNRATGETQWLSPGKGSKGDASAAAEKESEHETPPRILAAKAIKTPAQYRLKRLQHDIKVDRLKKDTRKPNRRTELDPKSKKFSNAIEQQENKTIELPSTSGSSKIKDKINTKSITSPARPSKRPNITATESSKDEVKNKLAKVSTVKNKGKQSFKTPLSSASKLNDDDVLMASSSCSTAHAASGTGILSKLKDIFKLPFMSSKTHSDISENENEKTSKTTSPTKSPPSVLKALSELRAEQKKIEKQNILNKSLETTASVNNKPCSSVMLDALGKVRTPKKKIDKTIIDRTSFGKLASNKKSPTSSTVQEALKELRNQQKQFENNRDDKNQSETSLDNSSLFSTPKNLSIPNYQRGSANSRLDRLRQSLLLQQQSTTSANAITSPSITVPTTPTTTQPVLPSTSFNISSNSLYETANNTINDEIEAMDWQPSEKEDIVQLSCTEPSTSIVSPNKTQKTTTKNVVKTKLAETMGEIYDTVSENLLRLSAEKTRNKEKNAKKWLKDFYYFVVDTNVLLDYLSFLEDLSQLKLCDTQGSVLYIPYGVLQELDKLKMRSGCQEGVKTMAVRAIKYLNKKFESNNLNLQAQTAIEERQHIIDVNSADDSIINCCLQAKQQVPNLVLLTEDVNLRNKAICNNILVTTKSDLMCKRYDSM